MRAPAFLAAALLAAGSLQAFPVAAAPELGLQLGRSFAARTARANVLLQDANGAAITTLQANREPKGSFSIGGSLLWPWEDRFRFGVTVAALDMGSWLFLDEPGEPATVAALDIGGLEVGHLAGWAGAWRFDALGPKAGWAGRTYSSFTYGYYRWIVDRHGEAVRGASSLGASAAVGVEHVMGPRQSLGLAISFTRMTGDLAEHSLGASLEWRWRP